MAPPKKKVPSGPTPVEAFVHEAKRANLPTSDAQEFITPEIEASVTVSYPREISSPMLVWQGKEAQDASDLTVDAPPIYIQEKIDPRVLVENLRRTAQEGEAEPELTLFETFDGLTDLDLVEFYRHDANWSNRMILGDSLQVMASLESRERLRGKVQMIYIDPPYGIKFGSNWQVSARSRDVRDGRMEDAAREAEQIKAFRDTWELGIHSYLTYLRDRLQVARDLLSESGSLFLQMGDENIHLGRSLLDEVFGRHNFCCLVTIKKTGGLGSDLLKNVSDYLVWYAKDRSLVKYRQMFNSKMQGIGATTGARYDQVRLASGEVRPLTAEERLDPSRIPSTARTFQIDNLVSSGTTPTCIYPYTFEGITYTAGGQRSWKTNRQGMDNLATAHRLVGTGRSLRYVRYLDDFPAFEPNNIWEDIAVGTDKIYVVQTPASVIARVLWMTTDPGDLVLDPTCGSGTTAYVAEQWGRRWITIDTSRVALALARQRLMGARFPYYLLRDSAEGRKKESELSATPPAPAAITKDLRQGFVNERVQHITLKSIANNPDIREGMSRAEIDAAIKRHAEFEELVDKPYIDNRKVRVTGPYTVESLSPHRALAFATTGESVTVGEAAVDPDAPTFEQTILDNLRVAGVQNGKRAERLVFDDVEPYAGTHIQAVGVRTDVGSGGPARTGISIGPQYGTVDARFVKDAAREAGKAAELDLLCVMGFAFDPQVLGASEEFVATDESFGVAAERALGRVPVLLVRMNSDLLMGEELKKTGAGNLFTVFGEPEYRTAHHRRWRTGGGAQGRRRVRPHYGPGSQHRRGSGGPVDDRHRLQRRVLLHPTLLLHRRPGPLQAPQAGPQIRDRRGRLGHPVPQHLPTFAPPSTGKLAVKVINDYGDEVVKVFEVAEPSGVGFPFHPERPR